MQTKMDSKLQSLPPHKRFRLHQQQQQEENKENSSIPSDLPVKKRKQSRAPPPLSPRRTDTDTASRSVFSLPAKKRVCARFPLCPIDLNNDENEVKPEDLINNIPSSDDLRVQPPCTTTAYSLPAKKRVWSQSPLCPLDLNKDGNKLKPEGVVTNIPSSNHRPLQPHTVTTVLCLPAKKPVCAQVPLCPLDKEEMKLKPEKVVINMPSSDDPPLQPPCTTTAYSLPTKKRVSAPNPDLSNQFLLCPIDLNKPSLDESSKPEEGKVTSLLSAHDDDDDDDGICCAVCGSPDGDPSDPIVFCDGCDLMVHSKCYGDPLIKGIPEGDWFCAVCLSTKSSAKHSISCCLCPFDSNAMKPTNDGRWAHIVCALFVPEVFFEDSNGREGIDCSKVPSRRWIEKCYICKSKNGCAIECSEAKCPLAFHVTCGLKDDLIIEYNEGKKEKKQGDVIAGFCKDHSDLWKKQQKTGKYKIVAREE